jgi:hypothetical protein
MLRFKQVFHIPTAYEAFCMDLRSFIWIGVVPVKVFNFSYHQNKMTFLNNFFLQAATP